MTEHSAEERFESRGGMARAAVSCRRCGSSVRANQTAGPGWRPDELLSVVWKRFLLNVFWDCDEALVENIMGR